jgi:hypothetical protein
MNKAILINIICIFTLLLIGCDRSVDKSIPVDTSRLDELVRNEPTLAPFADSVRQLYKAFENKEWGKTYEFRTNKFKKSIRESVYMEIAEHRGKSWTLHGYEILDVIPHSIEGQEPSLIRLIMKFHEDNITTFNVVWWIKEEDNLWHCLDVGPKGPAGLGSLLRDGRIPNYLFKEFKEYK